LLDRPVGKGSLDASFEIWDDPIVRATGEPDDSGEPDAPKSDRGIGCTCESDHLDVGAEALLATLQEALTPSYHRAAWKRLMGRAIQADFSRRTSARAHAESYIKAMTERRRSLALGEPPFRPAPREKRTGTFGGVAAPLTIPW
jgi:hypothetical protein